MRFTRNSPNPKQDLNVEGHACKARTLKYLGTVMRKKLESGMRRVSTIKLLL
jgi:hypothetical protein